MLSWIIRSINLPKNLELQQSSLISEFDIKTASDIQTALKELLSKTIQEMIEEEMSEHLGYNKSERSSTGTDYRNGYNNKQITSNFGKLSI